MSDFQSGAQIDTRSDEQKQSDIQFKEIVAAVAPVIWMEKPRDKWRKFPIFNQDGSGSCVAQTVAKLLGVLYWLKNAIYVHFSATDVYQRRSNKPASGMAGVEAFDIAQKGVTLEELVPSQGMSDQQMDGVVIPQYKHDVGAVFKIGKPVILPTQDIETIASVIQATGKAVMVWFFFKIDEWTEVPTIKYPALGLTEQSTCRHSVTAVDSTLYNGKKALIIEDSWGTSYGLAGQRVITEDFFKARNWFAAYPMNFKFDDQTKPEPTPTKPKYHFDTDMEFGQTNNIIKALQDLLKYEGCLATNITSTGYFGAATKMAVQKFQDKHNIAHAGDAGYGRVGPKTRGYINQNYS